MYRVHANDGNLYEAPSLAVLQQWVQEGRLIPSTVVEDLLSGTEGPASAIEGLRFHLAGDYTEPSAGNAEYPRVTPVQNPGCAVHVPLVLVTLTTCFFAPAGVIGVIFAAKIPQLLAQGDTEKAKQYARIAYLFAALALVLGTLFQMLLMKYGKALGLPVS